MIDVPGFPDPTGLVTEPRTTVEVGGQAMEAASVSVSRSFGTGLPAQVAGVDDMVGATGSVEADLPESLVTEGLHLPWVTPGPQPGDSVVVESGLDDVMAPVLVGRVDSPSASVRDRTVQFSVVDEIDRLRRRISIDPLDRLMPGIEEYAEPLMIGLHPTYITDRAARRCGYHATPPLQLDAVVSAPLTGSAWPERGTLTRATGTGANIGQYPTYTSAPWGLCTRNITATWEPYFPAGVTGKMDRWAYVHFLVAPVGAAGAARVELHWPSGARIIVRLTQLALTLDCFNTAAGDVPNGDSRVRLDFPAPLYDGAEVSAWVNQWGGVVLEVARWGEQIGWGFLSGNVTLPPDSITTPLERVRAYSDGGGGADIGGLQVGFAPAARDLHEWEQTAIIETNPDRQLQWVPSIVDRDCLDILKEQAGAEMAAIWLDARGRLRYRSMERLLTPQVPREDLPRITVHDVQDIDWSTGWDSVHESVTVKYQTPAYRRSPSILTAEVWRAGGITLGPGEVHEEIVTVPSGADWINVGPLHILTDDPSDLYWYRNRRRSWVAGVIRDIDETESSVAIPATSSHISASFQRITATTYKLRIEAKPGSFPATKQLELKVPGWTSLRSDLRGEDTPVIRADRSIEATEQTAMGQPFGPASTGAFEHDTGFWVQTEGAAKAIADHIAWYTSTPRPVMDRVQVTGPDARRELGDLVVVDLPGVELLALAVGITTTAAPTGTTQDLTLQVIDTTIEEAI